MPVLQKFRKTAEVEKDSKAKEGICLNQGNDLNFESEVKSTDYTRNDVEPTFLNPTTPVQESTPTVSTCSL